MQGRLGNQMFQYATLRAYMEKYGNEKLVLDFGMLEDKSFKDELCNFKVIPYKKYVDHEKFKRECQMDLMQKIAFKKMIAMRKIIAIRGRKTHNEDSILRKYEFKKSKKLMEKFGLYFVNQGYIELKGTKKNNKYFYGFFESPKYFCNIKKQLMREFTPKNKKMFKNLKLYDLIEKTNSVCVTIRRGDFVDDAKNVGNHYVCTPDYFYKAIDKMNSIIKHPQFIIFSDDIEWVRQNMFFPKGTVFEDGTDPVWEKIRLMYSCKHFIISNSTFSWWAQYLSRNNEKKVIAPSIWKNYYQNDDIYEPDWILIKP